MSFCFVKTFLSVTLVMLLSLICLNDQNFKIMTTELFTCYRLSESNLRVLLQYCYELKDTYRVILAVPKVGYNIDERLGSSLIQGFRFVRIISQVQLGSHRNFKLPTQALKELLKLVSNVWLIISFKLKTANAS